MQHIEIIPATRPRGIGSAWFYATDGSFPAKLYWEDACDRSVQLTNILRQMGAAGYLSRERGHQLDAPFADLYEFKPPGHRFVAFRDGDRYLVTNAGKKGATKKMNRIYQTGLDHYNEYQERKKLRLLGPIR